MIDQTGIKLSKNDSDKAFEVNWDNHRMKQLERLLKKVDDFEDDHEYDETFAEAHFNDYDVPFEPNNQEFWVLHYQI